MLKVHVWKFFLKTVKIVKNKTCVFIIGTFTYLVSFCLIGIEELNVIRQLCNSHVLLLKMLYAEAFLVLRLFFWSLLRNTSTYSKHGIFVCSYMLFCTKNAFVLTCCSNIRSTISGKERLLNLKVFDFTLISQFCCKASHS